jgi:hypothetical protein
MRSARAGGIAALAGAATNLLGLVVFVALLLPKGLGDAEAEPSKVVALLVDNETAMRLWYQITYLAFGACVVVLVLALRGRLSGGTTTLADGVTTVGLIYAVLVMAVGVLYITDLHTIVQVSGKDPDRAVTVYQTLTSVENGLGAGGGETAAVSLWLLLLSWAALRAGRLPRALNYLGVGLGVGGAVCVVTGSVAVSSVFGVLLIAWFIWLGIALLREAPEPSRGALRHQTDPVSTATP